MNNETPIPCLVLDTNSETLSIEYVDWSKFSFVPKENDPNNIFDYFMDGITYTDVQNSINENYARQDFLKQQITQKIPSGVIVSTPRMEGNFYYDEWDVLNIIKFEIHSDFSEGLTYLKLVWFLRPLAINNLSAINQTFGLETDISNLYSSEEHFEVSIKGWLKCYNKAMSIQNEFIAQMNNEIDNTPYYNTKLQWER